MTEINRDLADVKTGNISLQPIKDQQDQPIKQYIPLVVDLPPPSDIPDAEFKNGTFTPGSETNDLLSTKGISSARPELIAVTKFEPCWDATLGNQKTATHDMLMTQAAARRLREENLNKFVQYLQEDSETKPIIDQLLQSFNNNVNLTSQDIENIRRVWTDFDNFMFALQFYEQRVNIYNSAADAQNGIGQLYNVEQVFTKQGFNPDNIKFWSNTKVVGQMLQDLSFAARKWTFGMFPNSPGGKIDKITRSGDVDPFTYRSFSPTVGFSFNVENYVNAAVPTNGFNELRTKGTIFMPASRTDKLKLLLITLTKAFGGSHAQSIVTYRRKYQSILGTSIDDSKNFIAQFVGTTRTIAQTTTPANSVLGTLRITTSASALALVADQVSNTVLPLERRDVSYNTSPIINAASGYDYFFSGLTSATTGDNLNTQRISDFKAKFFDRMINALDVIDISCLTDSNVSRNYNSQQRFSLRAEALLKDAIGLISNSELLTNNSNSDHRLLRAVFHHANIDLQINSLLSQTLFITLWNKTLKGDSGVFAVEDAIKNEINRFGKLPDLATSKFSTTEINLERNSQLELEITTDEILDILCIKIMNRINVILKNPTNNKPTQQQTLQTQVPSPPPSKPGQQGTKPSFKTVAGFGAPLETTSKGVWPSAGGGAGGAFNFGKQDLPGGADNPEPPSSGNPPSPPPPPQTPPQPIDNNKNSAETTPFALKRALKRFMDDNFIFEFIKRVESLASDTISQSISNNEFVGGHLSQNGTTKFMNLSSSMRLMMYFQIFITLIGSYKFSYLTKQYLGGKIGLVINNSVTAIRNFKNLNWITNEFGSLANSFAEDRLIIQSMTSLLRAYITKIVKFYNTKIINFTVGGVQQTTIINNTNAQPIILNERNARRILVSKQQTALSMLELDDIKRSLDRGSIFSDDNSITPVLERLLLDKLLKSPGYNEPNLMKILTIGLCPGTNSIIEARDKTTRSSIPRRNWRQSDIVTVDVYVKNLLEEDVIFKPLQFTFELSRFVNMKSFDRITDSELAQKNYDYITRNFVDFVDVSLMTRQGSAVERKNGVDTAKFERYKFLDVNTLRSIFRNHTTSYLLGLYIKLLTGVSTQEKSFLFEPEIMKFQASEQTNNLFRQLSEVLIRKNSPTLTLQQFIAKYPQFGQKLQQSLQGGQFGTGMFEDAKILDPALFENASDIIIAQDLFDISKLNSAKTTLTGGEKIRTRVTSPKLFERIFNVPAYLPNFEVDVQKTNASQPGTNALTRLGDTGLLTLSFGRTYFRWNRENVRAAQFWATISTLDV